MSSKDIDSLSSRIQRLRLKSMQFLFEMRYVPGKNNNLPDLLSREPLEVRHIDSLESQAMQAHSRIDIGYGIKVEKIRLAQLNDGICSKLKDYVKLGWPKYLSQLDSVIKPYWELQAHIVEVDGVLLQGPRIIIPTSARVEMLNRIHQGHLGINKCRELAKQSVWWPGMSLDIKNMVDTCRICKKVQAVKYEPLKPSLWPEIPWHTLGTDLFEFEGNTYLLVVDYHSRYPEVIKLRSSQSKEVIKQLIKMFGRHGIPEVIRSDNGPQYSSNEFKEFVKEFEIQHFTSSPNYPQSNGEAERMVRTVKSILRKNENLELGLLAYRNAPLQNGLSPAKLLMGRILSSRIPRLGNGVNKNIDVSVLKEREMANRMRQKVQFDNRHKAIEAKVLERGEEVWVKDLNRKETVVDKLGDRDYRVTSGIRRNNIRLNHLPINNDITNEIHHQ